MFSEPLSECSCRFTSVFFITLHPGTFVSVDHSTLRCDGISLPGGHKEIFGGSASFEIYLYFMLVTNVCDSLTKPSGVRLCHVGVVPIDNTGLFLLLVLLEDLF